MNSAHSFVVLALVAIAGCNSSTQSADAGGGGTANPTCLAIMERCHSLDVGLGEVHECHEFAEDLATSEADCVAMRAHCFEVCTPEDAGTGGDAGAATDSGTLTDAGDAR